MLAVVASFISAFTRGASAAGADVSRACANWKLDHTSIGFYFPTRGAFYLQDSDRSEFIQELAFGRPSPYLIAIAGDWAGRGFDSLGLYDPTSSEFQLKYEVAPGPPDEVFRFGAPKSGALPVAGHWTDRRKATVGLFDPRSGIFRIRNVIGAGRPELELPFGVPNDRRIPIVGDWVGDGISRVGLFDPMTSQFHLRLTNDPANEAERVFQFGGGNTGWMPVIGKWVAGSQTDDIGLHKGNAAILRYALTGGDGDKAITLAPQGTPGGEGPQVISGHWKPSRCRSAGQPTSPKSPDWARDLILYELRIETFNDQEGSPGFATAAEKLPELQALGVTGLVIDPIEDGISAPDIRRSNFYGPRMPDRINSRLGGPEAFKAFVAKAHQLDMKVIVNNVLHGLVAGSPYVGPGPMAFPVDWFGRASNGQPAMTTWGTVQLDWTSPGLREWWIDKIGVGWVELYDVDGFRMDLEPAVAGTPLWGPLRAAVRDRTGKQILLMPEIATPGRGYTYDMAQNNVSASEFLNQKRNIVEFVRSMQETLYTSSLSNHDSHEYFAQGRLSAFAYGAVLAPLIPYWFAGEEFNATPDYIFGRDQRGLYFSQLHWRDKSANAKFYDQVANLIAIRKKYKHIIAPLDRPLHTVNIANVTRHSGTDLQPYVMWDADTAIAVLASRDAPDAMSNFSIPVDRLGMTAAHFEVTNLMTGQSLVHTRAELVAGLSFPLLRGGVVPIKVQALSARR